MTQNTSHAVMSQRVEPHDSLDFFPTPPWATRALCEWLSESRNLRLVSCWEPACGEGHMARPLTEYFMRVVVSDIRDYGLGNPDFVSDFLWDDPDPPRVDWVITNPPFRLGEQFARKAIRIAQHGAALIVRTAFLESGGRFRELFAPNPPSDILQFTERVPMHKGRLDQFGSTATAYCWIVWRKHAPPGTRFHWIAPCRKRLEKPSDYVPLTHPNTIQQEPETA